MVCLLMLSKFLECFKYCEVTQELHNKYSIVFPLYHYHYRNILIGVPIIVGKQLIAFWAIIWQSAATSELCVQSLWEVTGTKLLTSTHQLLNSVLSHKIYID